MSRYIFKPVLLLCVAVFLLSCGEAMPDFPFDHRSNSLGNP